jgi:hypothetical protein
MYWSLDDCISPKKNEYNLLSTEPELKHTSGHETEQLNYWSLTTDYWSLEPCHLPIFDYAQGDVSTWCSHFIFLRHRTCYLSLAICHCSMITCHLNLKFNQYLTQISSRLFLFISGTKVSFSGYPTGINKKGFSFSGRFRIVFKKFIGLGVCVKATNPQ